MDVDVSVIVPVRNAAATLGSQLDALANQIEAASFEVVAVLNCSSDRSRFIAEGFGSRLPITVLEADERPSAAYARNLGAKAARGSLLLFCDADDQVDRRWLAGMTSVLRSGSADVVGGRIVVDRRGLPDWIYRRWYEFLDGKCLVDRGELRYGVGASLGCTRAAFDAVGGFDEDFECGSEEIDLQERLQRAGFRISAAPDAILQYTPRTTMRRALRQRRSYARGETILAAKDGRLGPPPSRLALVTQPARAARKHALRNREWRPHVIWCVAMERFYKLQEHRRRAVSGSG